MTEINHKDLPQDAVRWGVGVPEIDADGCLPHRHIGLVALHETVLRPRRAAAAKEAAS